MKKIVLAMIALSVGLFTTACSFHSETSFDKSISATKDLGNTEPAKIEIDGKPLANPEATKGSKPKMPSSNTSGKACNKHEECNKVDELCYWGTCQTVTKIKQTLGFNDDFSNDPCSEKACEHCTEGKMKTSGMGYGIDDTNIQASVCIECMFNDACKPGFRCLNEQCVDAATHHYCDFMRECLEGFSCENSQCVKSTDTPAN
jgi:hypothetical protein